MVADQVHAAPPAAPGGDPLLAALPNGLPAVERRPAVPDGFVVGGATCGIKASGRPDLALVVVTGSPASAAGVFTRNAFAAAPVELSRRHLAATGALGAADQLEIARAVAGAIGAPVDAVLCLSTGVIGTRLPVERVVDGVGRLVDGALSGEPDGLLAAAEALRTTDSRPKLATTEVSIDGRPVRVSGIAKGVGMIHPGMATMLSVVLTDARVEPGLLAELLRRATSRTWNQLSVDGDTSTNDTVFVLASGAADTAEVAPRSEAAATLGAALEAVARDLARQQAADGEGATALLTCQVSGARDDADARAVARAVISSSLVKAAVHGKDPNWGRIAGAAGNALLPEPAVLEVAGLSPADAEARGGRAAAVDPDRVRIAIAGHLVFDGPAGGPVEFDRAAARAAMSGDEVLLRVDLGLGDGTGEAFGCDLTEEYVRENSEYTT